MAHLSGGGNMFTPAKMFSMVRWFKNAIQNGNLANGTTGWIHYGTHSAESIVDGWLRSAKNSSRPYAGRNAEYSFAVGTKIYFKLKARGSKNGNATFQLCGTAGSFGALPGGSFALNLTTEEATYTGVITVVDELTAGLTVVSGFAIDGTNYTTDGDYVEYKDVVICDISNHPAAEQNTTWCDANIAPFITW
jgi:hypothetical protein